MSEKTNNKDKPTSVSLVLGSGGARGMAHIGVIHWLEENGFHIKSVSGASIGALVGGVHAAGKLDVLEEWARAIQGFDIVKLLDISWQKGGFVKGDKIIDTLTELIGDVEIEDLPIQYTAVATDILNEKEVWINEGSLFSAIRASISLPLFFSPAKYKGIELIDGGVLNPVPIAPTLADSTDLTIAVNLGSKSDIFSRDLQEDAKSQKSTGADSLLTEKISGFFNSLIDTQGDDSSDSSVYDVANQAFDTMQSALARQQLAIYPPDHLIEISRTKCGILDFGSASTMINHGYAKAHSALKHLL